MKLPSPWSSCVGWKCGSLTSAVSCITQKPPWPTPAALEWRGPAEASDTQSLQTASHGLMFASFMKNTADFSPESVFWFYSRRRPGVARARREPRTATASWAAGRSAAPSCRTGGCGQTGTPPALWGCEGEWRTCRCSLPPERIIQMANQDTDTQTELCISAYIELATVMRSNIFNS